MKLLPAITCFLAAVISGGYSLICDTCTNANGDSCTGAAQTCDASQDTCIFTLTETRTPKEKTQSFAKSCGKSKDCKLLSSMSNEQVKIMSTSKCCNTDRCTPEPVSVPRRDEEANGIVCPACYTSSTEECTGQGTVQCKGVENQCIKYGMPVATGADAPYAIRGCANKIMCDTKGKLAFPSITAELKKFECSHGSHLQHNFSFSALIGLLLLLKLLS
ncbi:phospholipase A2 inhibitor and Ly6/PLAUR domain-containing protein [Ambystoma mexicanum]|uniref:phospholipase A2 inhibitor and Ly6/PLAUR domain-containing protein n=1 Tax=Ambystoma mexicanum TaxID=8296 RepID=UPI0037E8B7B8